MLILKDLIFNKKNDKRDFINSHDKRHFKNGGNALSSSIDLKESKFSGATDKRARKGVNGRSIVSSSVVLA